MYKFLRFLTIGPAVLALYASVAYAGETIKVTDIAGRTVTLEVPVKHMVLGEGRFLPTLGILDRKDPTQRVVGMMGDFKKYDPASYAQFAKHFPSVDNIPIIGSSGAASFSVEKAFSVKPDLAVFGYSSGHGPSNRNKAILDQFKAAGIPVVVIDFRFEPLLNTPKSLRLLGKLMGREKEAEEFLTFYTQQLDIVKKGLKGVTKKPSVFLESRVGLRSQCCEAMGNTMMGRFIEWAGGSNAFGKIVPGIIGMVNVEHLLKHQPDFYVGTAIGSPSRDSKSNRFIILGANTEADLARNSLKFTSKRNGPAQLNAIKSGRAYAIWHHFYNTPMHVAAIQAMAKWFHPNRFKNLNPNKTLETYFQRFQPYELSGVYWTSLKSDKGT